LAYVERRRSLSEDIEDGEIKRADIGTRQIREEHIEDYQILRRHIATRQIHSEKLEYRTGVVGPIPDVDTEYAYPPPGDLPEPPTLVSVHPTTAGVAGYVMEAAVSATSITLRASVSGVYARYTVIR